MSYLSISSGRTNERNGINRRKLEVLKTKSPGETDVIRSILLIRS